MFEDLDIIIETEFSIEDWKGFCEEAEQSLLVKLFNLTLYGMLDSSRQLGWNPEEESLGAFASRNAEESARGDDLESFVIGIGKDKSYIELLDKYGEAWHRDESNPVLILKDKETGEIPDFNHFGLLDLFLMKEIVDLYER